MPDVKNDLIWDLNGISNRDEALSFLKLFENRLFVYSYTVQKIYSNYSFVFPEHEDGKIAVLPDHLRHHDVFQDVPNEAIEKTDISVFPGDIVGLDNIAIKYHSFRGGASKTLPLREGLINLIDEYSRMGLSFLPVISNGDLREYENRMPCLYLQNVNINTMTQSVSKLDGETLKTAVCDSLIKLMTDYKEV